MGFTWGVGIRLEYTQTIEIPSFPTRFIKRLIEWSPHAVHGDVVAREAGERKRRKRSHPQTGLPGDDIVPVEWGEWPFSQDPDPCVFSDSPVELDDEQTELMGELEQNLYGDKSHHPDNQFYLNDNIVLMDKAFGRAVRLLLGDEHSVELIYADGGAYGEPDEGAEREAMYLTCRKSLTTAGGTCDPPRGSINVPWGVAVTRMKRLNREEEAATVADFARVCKAFDLKPVGEVGYHLVSFANGG